MVFRGVKKKYLTSRKAAYRIGQVRLFRPVLFMPSGTERFAFRNGTVCLPEWNGLHFLREQGRQMGAAMENIVEQGLLFDFYGQLLTPHQQKIYRLAVYDDLSLNEIAETEGISKQAVHDLIRRTTRIMQRYEEHLGMIGRFDKIRRSADGLIAAASSMEDGDRFRQLVLQAAEQIKKDLE